jgi:hypothetical protein
LLSNSVVQTQAGVPVVQNDNLSGQKFISKSYALIFYENGQVDVYDRGNRKENLVGSFGKFSFPAGGIQSASKVSISMGPKHISEKEIVQVANVATVLKQKEGTWPEVTVNYEIPNGTLTACWTLMPEMAHIRFTVSTGGENKTPEGPATLDFKLKDPANLIKEIKPARWQRHPCGGVPFQLTAGMANQYQVGKTKLILANDRGLTKLYDEGKINLYVREVPCPWQRNQFQANTVISFSNASMALPLAVAAAGEDRLMLEIKSPMPFYLGDNLKDPIILEAAVVNLVPRPERVDLDYTARNYDGQIIDQGRISKILGPLAVWQRPLKLFPKEVGPIYVEVIAQHSQSTVFQNLCLGVMPKREFLDGKASRFGISAYRGTVGSHTELRTEKQLLELMKQIGIRWLRMSNDAKLAHEMGFYTWYLNGPPINSDYIDGKPTWMSEAKNREDFLRGNLDHALKAGDEVFEFSNEWNLTGGEEKGVLADRYAREWAIPLKAIRDQMCPKVRLAGCVIANGDQTYLNKVYKAGAWDSFDILAFHAVGCPRSCDFDDGKEYWSYLATLRRIHEVMRELGKKELWMTEFYAPTAPNNSCSNNERIAAEEITLQCALAVAADVRGFMFYCLDDFEREEEIKTALQVGEPMERESYFGLVRRDWTPKAGLWAYQTAAYCFDGAKFVGDISMPDPKFFGMAFDGRNGHFAVLWSRKEGYLPHNPSHLRLAHRQPWEDVWTLRTPFSFASNSEVTVVDCIGRSRKIVPDKDGKVTIELTGAPVYVFGGNFKPFTGRFYQMFHDN